MQVNKGIKGVFLREFVKIGFALISVKGNNCA